MQVIDVFVLFDFLLLKYIPCSFMYYIDFLQHTTDSAVLQLHTFLVQFKMMAIFESSIVDQHTDFGLPLNI